MDEGVAIGLPLGIFGGLLLIIGGVIAFIRSRHGYSPLDTQEPQGRSGMISVGRGSDPSQFQPTLNTVMRGVRDDFN